MVSYFLDEVPQIGKRRTVRSASCQELPEYYERIFLGEYERIEPALKKALRYHAAVTKCACCCVGDQAVLSCTPIRKAS